MSRGISTSNTPYNQANSPYKHITSEDIQHDPDWMFAPVLVATNRERINISATKARLWASMHKTYVFKWKKKILMQINRPAAEKMSDIMEKRFLLAALGSGCSIILNQ